MAGGQAPPYNKQRKEVTAMKRIWAALLCLCLLMTSVPYAALAAGEQPVTGTVYGLDNGYTLRVRSEPNTDGKVLEQLHNGDVVTILDTSEDKGWYQVLTPSGTTGWSSATFIRINSTEPEPLPKDATGTVFGIIADHKLYVYQNADKTGKVLDKLSNDAVVAVLAQSKDGQVYQITTPSGITGWCTAAFVRINKSYETDEAFEAHLTEQGFPEDYKDALRKLYAHHPNWVFKAQHLSMTWAEAVAAESEALINALDMDVAPEAWLSMEYGAYNWDKNQYEAVDDGGWVTASSGIIAHYMDPRNFLDFTYIFQFEDLLYSDKHAITGVQAILPTRYDGYAEDLLKAAKDANVNAYFLAARMTQEGSKIDGTWVGDDGVSYKGYYNFFNIGAYAGSQHGAYHGAVTNGAIYAKKQGWDSPYNCIVGSAQFLGRNYIHRGQNTIYYQKFNVAGDNLYANQYMTNLQAPSSESKIRAGKATPEELAGGMTFVLPVYKEMPADPVPQPATKGNNNNFLDSLTVDGFKLSPSFDRYTADYAVEVTAETTTVTITAVTNHKDATVTGGGVIQLHTGDNLLPVTVTATSGATRTYTLAVFCKAEVPDNPDLPPTPPVTPTPVITGTTYRVGDTVTGVEPQTTVADFVNNLVVVDGIAKVIAANGSEKAEGVIATGDTLHILDNDGKVCQSTPVLICGDVNGDGKISPLDLTIIRKHILNISALEGMLITAGDANKDGKLSPIDLTIIRKFILKMTTTIQ